MLITTDSVDKKVGERKLAIKYAVLHYGEIIDMEKLKMEQGKLLLVAVWKQQQRINGNAHSIS
ncbi:hypothetical protein QUF74_01735 [Candidatus Halobeggiatoa sp. HSG11]|nr:hypothetical protein [Candidatus Halobeggiatoa sp. HSG11]